MVVVVIVIVIIIIVVVIVIVIVVVIVELDFEFIEVCGGVGLGWLFYYQVYAEICFITQLQYICLVQSVDWGVSPTLFLLIYSYFSFFGLIFLPRAQFKV